MLADRRGGEGRVSLLNFEVVEVWVWVLRKQTVALGFAEQENHRTRHFRWWQGESFKVSGWKSWFSQISRQKALVDRLKRL